jgi:hypothetical protein
MYLSKIWATTLDQFLKLLPVVSAGLPSPPQNFISGVGVGMDHTGEEVDVRAVLVQQHDLGRLLITAAGGKPACVISLEYLWSVGGKCLLPSQGDAGFVRSLCSSLM